MTLTSPASDVPNPTTQSRNDFRVAVTNESKSVHRLIPLVSPVDFCIDLRSWAGGHRGVLRNYQLLDSLKESVYVVGGIPAPLLTRRVTSSRRVQASRT